MARRMRRFSSSWSSGFWMCAKLHCLDGGFHGAVPGHHDEFDLRVFTLDGAEELDAVHVGHLKVRENEIYVAILRQHRQRLARGCDGAGPIAFAFEKPGAHGAMVGIVFNDEDSGGLRQRRPQPSQVNRRGTSYLCRSRCRIQSSPSDSRQSCNRSKDRGPCLSQPAWW